MNEAQARPDFPTVIDSSMRGTYRDCPQKFYQNYILHRQTPGTNINLLFGGCFAKALEVVRDAFTTEGLPIEEALVAGATEARAMWGDFQPPEGKNKTLPRLVEAIAEYFHEYPPYSDHIQPWRAGGKPCIEFSFSYPIDVKHPVTDEPILIAGRCDMVGDYHGACYAVDEKTTTQLGPSWLKQWHLRGQFTCYTWALLQAGFPAVGAIVRGMSILKTKFGHAEVLELRPQWMIDRWYEQFCYDVEDMIRDWKRGYWSWDLNSSCSDYGGCSYLGLCTVKNPDEWAKSEYEIRRWNPVKGEEEEVE